jgi:hypothetical protein
MMLLGGLGWYEAVTLFLTLAAAVAGGIAAYYAWKKEQARPKVRVHEIRLAELDEAGIKERVERFRKEREEQLRWERGREAREKGAREREQNMSPQEKRLRDEADRLTMNLWSTMPPPPPNPVPMSERPEGYEGPIPDKVLLITVVNEGKEAAYEVAGWLRLEASYLEPAKLFSSPNTQVSFSADGESYRVKVGGTETATLHPTRSARLRFRVAVATYSLGTTRIDYDFKPAVGDGDEDRVSLEISETAGLKPLSPRSPIPSPNTIDLSRSIMRKSARVWSKGSYTYATGAIAQKKGSEPVSWDLGLPASSTNRNSLPDDC